MKRKAQELAQNTTNTLCQTYVDHISNEHKQHMARNHVDIPVRDYVENVLTDIGIHFRNTERLLPAGGHYNEWYPVINGKLSPHKRVFTSFKDKRIWFSNGGTHGNTTDWWVKDGVNWTKKPSL